MGGSRASGFSLIELLVAVAIFALASALAWAGLAAVSRTRSKLAAEQTAFASVAHSVQLLARDLRTAVVRPVRAANGGELPAMVGDGTQLSLTRIGYLGAAGTAQSRLQRVTWRRDDHALVRARWTVLDRAPASTPVERKLNQTIGNFALRYLDHHGRWQTRWPAPDNADPAPLPRAVEFRIGFDGLGEIRRVVELVASEPVRARHAETAP